MRTAKHLRYQKCSTVSIIRPGAGMVEATVHQQKSTLKTVPGSKAWGGKPFLRDKSWYWKQQVAAGAAIPGIATPTPLKKTGETA